MPRRCSVKKLFESIQNKDKELTLAGVKKAFEKAAGPRRKSLTYKAMKTACGKYDGNYCTKHYDCALWCNKDVHMCTEEMDLFQ